MLQSTQRGCGCGSAIDAVQPLPSHATFAAQESSIAIEEKMLRDDHKSPSLRFVFIFTTTAAADDHLGLPQTTMTSKSTPATSSPLDRNAYPHILSNVLSYVPDKDLARLRTVSKEVCRYVDTVLGLVIEVEHMSDTDSLTIEFFGPQSQSAQSTQSTAGTRDCLMSGLWDLPYSRQQPAKLLPGLLNRLGPRIRHPISLWDQSEADSFEWATRSYRAPMWLTLYNCDKTIEAGVLNLIPTTVRVHYRHETTHARFMEQHRPWNDCGYYSPCSPGQSAPASRWDRPECLRDIPEPQWQVRLPQHTKRTKLVRSIVQHCSQARVDIGMFFRYDVVYFFGRCVHLCREDAECDLRNVDCVPPAVDDERAVVDDELPS